MRKNLLMERWAADEPVHNAWLSLADAFVAESMAHLGWHSVTVDMQHGLSDYAAAVRMLQGISTSDAVPMVRIPWNEPGTIMKLLDAGAYGIICPMINTAEEARAFVGACRYPPLGYRSFGPRRATLYGGADYVQHANDEIIAMAMIETAQAVENLDAILDTPGLTGIYMGPADLSASMGTTLKGGEADPEVEAAIIHIAERTQAKGLIAGCHTASAAQALRRIAQGYRYVTVQTEIQVLTTASSAILAELRGAESTQSNSILK